MLDTTANYLPIPARTRRPWRTLRLRAARAIAAARHRSLIGEILVGQLTIAALAGAIALAGLWGASRWVVQDNMREWGAQWLHNLDELAVPLYLPDDVHRYARADTYLDEFPEVLFVRYYSSDGGLTFTKSAGGRDLPIAPIELDRLVETASR